MELPNFSSKYNWCYVILAAMIVWPIWGANISMTILSLMYFYRLLLIITGAEDL